MADTDSKKQADLALTAKDAEEVKGGRAVAADDAARKKKKKKKTGAHTGGGRFQPQ
jgi:hypothetical protein